MKRFEQNIKTRDFTKMHSAIINGQLEIFEEELADVLLETISFNDAYENHIILISVGLFSMII